MVHPAVSLCTPSLTSRLREACSGVREQRDLLAGRVSWLDYRMFLLRMYGFHVAVERALVATRSLGDIIPDAKLRNHKAALLSHDLVSLGVDRVALAQAARLPFPGALTIPDALGWTYVLESVAQNNKTMVRHLQRQLPSELARSCAYLNVYGAEAPERWRELSDAIDRVDLVPRDADRVVATACDGFLQVRAWVAPALPPRSTRIHA